MFQNISELFFNYMYMCMGMGRAVHVSADTRGCQKRALDFLELELSSCKLYDVDARN